MLEIFGIMMLCKANRKLALAGLVPGSKFCDSCGAGIGG